ncbi:alpha/beta hydrolase fold-domain-containing protein [Cadophora sp. MPI-SDFR-AT-0126]|nr:alpha/beta hydrolase fold-domain-containing protein [Leotiomycetes sp. MPI-SDFR-AT-0126]
MDKVSPTSSIRVDRRESRSIANAAAQKLVSPFSSLILKPGKPQPGGSPQLTPPSRTQGDYSIEEWRIADTWLYTFKNLSKSKAETRHRIYYFAGGGFRGLPEKEHWTLCSDLSGMLPDYEISLVSYPLTPNCPASTALPHLERLCDALVQQSKQDNFRITFFGDSSGGNIAIVLGLYAASQYLKDTSAGLCPVEAVMAMCPATDMRNENPEIDVVEAHDPILSRKTIEEVAEGWRAELPASDPRVSPVLADLSVFKQAGIKVDGITAGYDTLTPDAIKFREKLADCGVDGDWLLWEKQMHCFPLLSAFRIREGTEGKKWIVDVLKKNVDGSRI